MEQVFDELHIKFTTDVCVIHHLLLLHSLTHSRSFHKMPTIQTNVATTTTKIDVKVNKTNTTKLIKTSSDEREKEHEDDEQAEMDEDAILRDRLNKLH